MVIEDFSADAFSVRSRTHEYGGGAFTIGNSTLWFSNGRKTVACIANRRVRNQSRLLQKANGGLLI